jgi:phosphoglycolate phosphatase-like HAD superfamily hydrolase|mmetsp:Transcript_2530/g.4319  ORF Transcript_2530/g.4319 Transcript_2530/m.4319 type:complete len:204 (-) Transcript_2530:279-890(-)|eukprot:CAMPEP_0169129116 /NCGR_PEP_ID=MMETSP1015-20121227/36949_1 /TAXON_ID=342587 /ORGANISM="Karlodinium micrum, Strain CCMP2283" /LENGTH=203 /DNA_ID=CAMNT_0009193103 /DNA_START=49 /DNA_END=660 /DNA_ORIENTATION=+
MIEASTKDETAIIFDWDDTLLCTTFLDQFKDGSVPAGVQAHLQLIEQAVGRLLDMALGLGHTFIVTNAVENWVEESAAHYLPGLAKTLQKVDIISARSTQESQGCGNVNEWKVRAFLALGNKLNSNKITNLISVGDSSHELEAANALSATSAKGLLKIIKLQESPSSQELLKQLNIILPRFGQLVAKKSNSMLSLARNRKIQP